MNIAHPATLWQFILILPIVLIMIYRYHVNSSNIQLLGINRGNRAYKHFAIRELFQSLAYIVAISMIILASTDISWGRISVNDDRQDVDIIGLIDISNSMLATDLFPNRLIRAKQIFATLVEHFPRSRFGIVAFKGAAIKLLPLTEDTIAVASLLESLDTNFITTPGTNIESGLTLAAESFIASANRNRVIVLFSDGEALDGNPAIIARAIFNRGIQINTVATATPEGSTITFNGTIITDSNGDAVVSRLNMESLSQIASAGGGISVQADNIASFSDLIDFIENEYIIREQQAIRFIDARKYNMFTFIAFACMAIYVILHGIPWKRENATRL